MYVGQIRICAFDVVPTGYLPCDGRELRIHEQPRLYREIGTTYGGDGKETFRLPDLRGRVPMHASDAPGSGMNLGASGDWEAMAPAPHENRQPSTVLNFIIALQNDRNENTPYYGEIRMLAHARVPHNWMACAGQLLSARNYAPLFSLLYESYGGGMQSDHFGLPNLAGRVPVCAGAGPGLMPRKRGYGEAYVNMAPYLAAHFVISITGGVYPTRDL